MWEAPKWGVGSEDCRVSWPPLSKPRLGLIAHKTVGIIRSCYFQCWGLCRKSETKEKFCVWFCHIVKCSHSFKAPHQPPSPPRSLSVWQCWPSPRASFLEHPMHLLSEQHILMSKYILSHVGLLFLQVGPNCTANCLKIETVLYTYFVSLMAFTPLLPT